MLKRVRIQGYKSLLDLDVPLLPLACLFGPNGAGKSNFLQALQLLAHIANHTNINAALTASQHSAHEIFTFIQGSSRAPIDQTLSCTLAIDLEISNATRTQLQEMLSLSAEGTQLQNLHLHYSITLELQGEKGEISIAQESLHSYYPKDENNQLFTFKMLREDQFLRIQHAVSPQLECASSEALISSGNTLQQQYPYLYALHREISGWQLHHLEPQWHMRNSFPAFDVTDIGVWGEQISAYVNRLCQQDEAKFNRIERTLQAIIPAIIGIDISVNNEDEAILRTIEPYLPIPIRNISDGTLRWLGFLLLHGVQEQPTLICLEEPESGIYPPTLKQLISLLKTLVYEGTQIITTTYSPLILKGLSPKYLYVCYKQGVQTQIEPLTTWFQQEANQQASTPNERQQMLEFVRTNGLVKSESPAKTSMVQ